MTDYAQIETLAGRIERKYWKLSLQSRRVLDRLTAAAPNHPLTREARVLHAVANRDANEMKAKRKAAKRRHLLMRIRELEKGIAALERPSGYRGPSKNGDRDPAPPAREIGEEPYR